MTAEGCQLSCLLLGKRQVPTGRERLCVGGNKNSQIIIAKDNNLSDSIEAMVRTLGIFFLNDT